jgi:hypothetical protein
MQAEELLQRVDKLPVHLRWLVRAALLAVTGFVFYMWCDIQLGALAAVSSFRSLHLHSSHTLGSATCSRHIQLLTAGASVLMRCRYSHVFLQPKLDYNKLHPYTSWIPILCWILVTARNCYCRSYRHASICKTVQAGGSLPHTTAEVVCNHRSIVHRCGT